MKYKRWSLDEKLEIIASSEEIRYWVRNVPPLPDADETPDLLKDLEKELPYFMYYINNRRIKTPRKTRMWFTKEQIYTNALAKLVKGNTTALNKEIEEILIDDFIKYEVNELKYSLNDMVEVLSKNNIRVSTSKVSKVFKNHFNLKSKNGSYGKYFLTTMPNDKKLFVDAVNLKGRYFTFLRKDYVTE
ncbi:MAG: hypothetical protein JKY08_05860 [Flavobacteriaceae bacterium]|nr:hypothetical protein [Flavobacteriaceae bacterium]